MCTNQFEVTQNQVVRLNQNAAKQKRSDTHGTLIATHTEIYERALLVFFLLYTICMIPFFEELTLRTHERTHGG